MRKTGTIDLIGIAIAIGFGVAVWGAVRAATIALPAVADFFLGVKIADDKPTQTPPEAPVEAERPTAAVVIDIETERPLEAWEEALESKLVDNDQFLRLGGRQWVIPNTVDVNHLFLLAEARANGKFRLAVSPNSLDTDAGISRNGKSPNAQSLIDFLASIGAVKGTGERRPYLWAELGMQLFPTKFESPLPPQISNDLVPVTS
jgi:hypothetical protein